MCDFDSWWLAVSDPTKTMYWAAQGMAAELAQGPSIREFQDLAKGGLRMFVVGTEAKFIKRAKGKFALPVRMFLKHGYYRRSAFYREGVELEMNVVGKIVLEMLSRLGIQVELSRKEVPS